jgi:uncharacterized protein (DUF4213/DUF364 family)/nucleoside-triphosphatase THEP1
MSSPHVAVAAVLHDDDVDVTEFLPELAERFKDGGVEVRGLVQRDTPNERGGHRHMDLVDVESGEAFRISEDLGKGSTSCCLKVAGLAEASHVLRRALEDRADLVLINRFGGQEIDGKGFSEDMLNLMAEGVPLLTVVAGRHKAFWHQFTGGCGVFLPPDAEAIERWFSGLPAARKKAGSAARHGVLAETIEVLSDLLGPGMRDIKVERVVIGQFFSGIKLATGSGGASFSPKKPVITSRNYRSLPKSIVSAGRLSGRRVGDFLDEVWDDAGASRALGIAVLNGLADTAWRLRPHPGWILDVGIDALTAVQPQPGEKVVMVGAFVSYVKRLREAGQPLTVLELDPSPLTEEELVHFQPADQAPKVVPRADLLLMTGSTLVNDTMDDLLALIEPQTRVAVIGPSVPLLPDVLAHHGADLLASIRITNPDHFLDVLAEGGGAQGIYDGSAELVVLRRNA